MIGGRDPISGILAGDSHSAYHGTTPYRVASLEVARNGIGTPRRIAAKELPLSV